MPHVVRPGGLWAWQDVFKQTVMAERGRGPPRPPFVYLNAHLVATAAGMHPHQSHEAVLASTFRALYPGLARPIDAVPNGRAFASQAVRALATRLPEARDDELPEMLAAAAAEHERLALAAVGAEEASLPAAAAAASERQVRAEDAAAQAERRHLAGRALQTTSVQLEAALCSPAEEALHRLREHAEELAATARGLDGEAARGVQASAERLLEAARSMPRGGTEARTSLETETARLAVEACALAASEEASRAEALRRLRESSERAELLREAQAAPPEFAAVRGAVHMARGVRDEPSAVRAGGFVGGDGRMRYESMVLAGREWRFGGKCDGHRGGELLEVKNRQNGLLGMQAHEEVQVRVYHLLYGADVCVFREVPRGAQVNLDRDLVVRRDDGRLRQLVEYGLGAFAASLDCMVQNQRYRAAVLRVGLSA